MKSFFSLLSRRIAIIAAVACFSTAVRAANIEVAGVPNFFKVNDQVYRGGQPLDLGFSALAKLGIKTIVDLRLIGEHSQEAEQKLVEAAGMRYVSIPMKGMSTPTTEAVSKVLALLRDAAAGPVFVHCRRGADRTGTVIAVYRIEHDHWKNDQALHEARSLGMSWLEKAMQHYVMRYQPPQLLGGVAAGGPAATEGAAVHPAVP